MKESEIVLTPIPQSDGTVKNRPAIVLRQMPPYNDFLVCGVTTQLHQEVKDFDDVIAISDKDFTTSGLRTESLIRLGFLAVLPSKNIIGAIGSIDTERHKKLLKRLSDYLVQ